MKFLAGLFAFAAPQAALEAAPFVQVVTASPAPTARLQPDEVDAALDEMAVLLDAGYSARYALTVAAVKLVEQHPAWAKRAPRSVRHWLRGIERAERARA